MPRRTVRYIWAEYDPLLQDIQGLLVGQTYDAVAAASGVSKSTIRNWMNGRVHRPQGFTMEQVLRSQGKTLSITDEIKPLLRKKEQKR